MPNLQDGENACIISHSDTTRWAIMRRLGDSTVRTTLLLNPRSVPNLTSLPPDRPCNPVCSTPARQGALKSPSTESRVAHRHPSHERYARVSIQCHTALITQSHNPHRRIRWNGHRRRCCSPQHARPREHHTASISQIMSVRRPSSDHAIFSLSLSPPPLMPTCE